MKNPTNADLLKEFKAMQATLLLQGEAIQKLDGRTANLEKRAIALDAAKKAVAEYKAEERTPGNTTIDAKVIMGLLAALGALTFALYLVVGKH